MIIKGISVWAHINKPSKESSYKGKTIPSVYSVDLMLDKATATKLKKEGYNIKAFKKDVPGIEDAIGKPYLTIKKKAKYQDGNDAKAPACVDTKLNKYTGLIGNGSKIKVNFNPFPHDMNGGGIAAQLRSVQVIDLVEVNTDGVDEFDEEEGYVVKGDASVSEVVDDNDLDAVDPW